MKNTWAIPMARGCWIVAGLLGLWAGPAVAKVNLEFRPAQPTVYLNGVLELGLYAVSDDETDQVVRGLQVILLWDPAYLELDPDQPLLNNGPYPWLMSGFYPDDEADGLNNTWTDGNAYYQAVGNFASLAYATPEGLLVTTFRFNPVEHTEATDIVMPPTYGQYTETQVFGEEVGEEVTGTLGTARARVRLPLDWGILGLALLDPMCGLIPGELVEVQLTVADLTEPINGVQALIGFDADTLGFVGAVPGDGAGSPWDNALEVFEGAEDGVLTYAVLLVDGGSAANAVVAELIFRYQPPQTPAAGVVAMLSEHPPLFTKLTAAATGASIVPELGPPVWLASPGDINTDGVIDAEDLIGFAQCVSGPGIPPCCDTCCRVDADADQDVDLVDFAALQCLLGQP